MRFDFVTLFPEVLPAAFGASILRRAIEANLLRVHAVNPRDFATDRHRTVDDRPFGGGPGMVLKPEPIDAALRSLELDSSAAVVLPDPTGPLFRQAHAIELGHRSQVVFVCGHYEGIDDRIRQKWITHSFSVGDYVLTGGELPALTMADAIARTLPGVLGDLESLSIDSHADGLLSAPQFTRPESWEQREVPEVLRSGDHGRIAQWKRRQSLRITRENRPDLLARAILLASDLELLADE